MVHGLPLNFFQTAIGTVATLVALLIATFIVVCIWNNRPQVPVEELQLLPEESPPEEIPEPLPVPSYLGSGVGARPFGSRRLSMLPPGVPSSTDPQPAARTPPRSPAAPPAESIFG